MLTDQWYVRADVLAKRRLKRLRTATFSSYRSSTKTVLLLDARYSGLVYLSSVVVGHRIPAWYDEAGNVYVGRNEAKCVKKITSVLMLSCVRTKTSRYLVLFCAVDLLYPWLAGNTDALRQFHPTSVMVSGFDIISSGLPA